MKIVIIGGTSLVGAQFTDRLNYLGHDAILAPPRSAVNMQTPAGLREVLRGAQVVVDVSNPPSFGDSSTMELFRISGENLMREEIRAAVKHHIVLSLVGTERLQESAYFRAKKVQENLVRKSGIPYSIIHSTQFFESALSIADASAKGNEIHLAPAEIQPIAAEDVSKAIVSVAVSDPVNGIIEIAGPDVLTLPEFVLQYLMIADDSRTVIVDARARYFGALLGKKTFMPEDEARLGTIRFNSWIRSQLVADEPKVLHR